jgi:hypothetical protein
MWFADPIPILTVNSVIVLNRIFDFLNMRCYYSAILYFPHHLRILTAYPKYYSPPPITGVGSTAVCRSPSLLQFIAIFIAYSVWTGTGTTVCFVSGA